MSISFIDFSRLDGFTFIVTVALSENVGVSFTLFVIVTVYVVLTNGLTSGSSILETRSGSLGLDFQVTIPSLIFSDFESLSFTLLPSHIV